MLVTATIDLTSRWCVTFDSCKITFNRTANSCRIHLTLWIYPLTNVHLYVFHSIDGTTVVISPAPRYIVTMDFVTLLNHPLKIYNMSHIHMYGRENM